MPPLTAAKPLNPSTVNPMMALGGGEEVTKPMLKTFSTVGEQQEGYLVDFDETGEIPGYIFEDVEANRFRLNVTADLKQKIRFDIHREHYIIVTYRGTDSSVNRNGNDMRIFKVEISRNARRK